MRRLKEYIGDVRAILTGRGSLMQRLRLWSDYTKVSILLFLEGRFIRTPQYVRFLSYQVYFSSFSEFFMLVREVFTQHPYFFELETEKPIIIDCGGNIGMSVLYFKFWHPNAEIHVFEPDPRVFVILERNVQRNNLESVYLHNIAIGDNDGRIAFYAREGMSLASTVVHIEGKKESVIEVPLRRLSGFLPPQVDLLKIDVQMSEGAVFRDLAESGKLDSIRNIIMEYHYLPGDLDHMLGDVLNMFDTHEMKYRVKLNTMLQDGFATYTIRAGELRHVLHGD